MLGRTDNGLPIEVFTGLGYDEGLFAAPVKPDGGRPMDRDELEQAAAACLRRTVRQAVGTGTAIGGLSEAQADGLACVICGANYLRVRLAHVPVGRSATGSRVFACVGRCTVFAPAEYPEGGAW